LRLGKAEPRRPGAHARNATPAQPRLYGPVLVWRPSGSAADRRLCPGQHPGDLQHLRLVRATPPFRRAVAVSVELGGGARNSTGGLPPVSSIHIRLISASIIAAFELAERPLRPPQWWPPHPTLPMFTAGCPTSGIMPQRVTISRAIWSPCWRSFSAPGVNHPVRAARPARRHIAPSMRARSIPLFLRVG